MKVLDNNFKCGQFNVFTKYKSLYMLTTLMSNPRLIPKNCSYQDKQTQHLKLSDLYTKTEVLTETT